MGICKIEIKYNFCKRGIIVNIFVFVQILCIHIPIFIFCKKIYNKIFDFFHLDSYLKLKIWIKYYRYKYQIPNTNVYDRKKVTKKTNRKLSFHQIWNLNEYSCIYICILYLRVCILYYPFWINQISTLFQTTKYCTYINNRKVCIYVIHTYIFRKFSCLYIICLPNTILNFPNLINMKFSMIKWKYYLNNNKIKQWNWIFKS